MKYFSEKDGFVNAECERCKRILRIRDEQAISNPDGFSLNPPSGVRCICGVVHHSITGTKQPLSSSSGNQHPPKKIAEINENEQHDRKKLYGTVILYILVIIIVTFVVRFMIGAFSSDSAKNTASITREEIREKQIEIEQRKKPEEPKLAAKQESDNIKSQVKVWTKQLVRESMKNPKSAEFASMWAPEEWSITDIGNNSWEVKSHVTATNSFNATIRSNFVAKIMYNKELDRGYLMSLTMDQ